MPAPLFGDALALPLDGLFAAGAAGPLTYAASSSDAAVAAARIADGRLVVEPAFAAEGVVVVEVTATDTAGQSATVSFTVRVEFHWPARPAAGWRTLLGAQ